MSTTFVYNSKTIVLSVTLFQRHQFLEHLIIYTGLIYVYIYLFIYHMAG